MDNHHVDSGPGEALASYRPTSLSESQWAAFRKDAVSLVNRLNHRDSKAASRCMSRLAVFLADESRLYPDATVGELLTRARVEGHLRRAHEAGEAPSTVRNRQGTLNALLQVQAGTTPPGRQRGARQRIKPYDPAMLHALLHRLAAMPSAHATPLAQAIVCVLAGQQLPGTAPVEISCENGQVAVDGRPVALPVDVPHPEPGRLNGDDVEVAVAWARSELELRLDRRSLELVAVTQVVATAPAVEALTLAGVGRDRLTAAADAAKRPDPATAAALLRGHPGVR